MKYTVLLLYPQEYTETYLAHVEATGVQKAIVLARNEAAEQTEEYLGSDFDVLAVFDGHLEDLKGGA